MNHFLHLNETEYVMTGSFFIMDRFVYFISVSSDSVL